MFHNKKLMGILLAISFLFMTTAFVTNNVIYGHNSTDLHEAFSDGEDQIDGWDCWGYVCWWEPVCAMVPPFLNQWYHCNNYCQNTLSGESACMAESWCGGPCG